MVSLASLIATLGFLVPVALLLGLRTRRERELWAIALDIPSAVALDLLFVIGLSRLMTVDRAALLSRGLYCVIGAALLLRNRFFGRPLPAWPTLLGRREVGLATAGTLLATLLSLVISRPYSIWDRKWHIPLVASLRGQTLPFTNVFNPEETLHYHFAGDVAAALLQTLSLGVLHASHALSLLHDILFALTGLTLSLFLVSWSVRGFAGIMGGTLGLLLTGPVTVLREGNWAIQKGYSLDNYFSLSYRPHGSLAGLLMLGFTGATVTRLCSRDELPLRCTAPALVVCSAALAVADESSLGMLGLALGLGWLFFPRIVHPRRAVGVLVFAALAAALIVPNLAFSASLSPGAARHVFTIVPWRSPGFYSPELPLTTGRGLLMLGFDLFAPATVAVAAVWQAHAQSRPIQGRWALAAFYLALSAASTLALTRLDMDGVGLENHRFVTALVFVGPFVGFAVLKAPFPEDTKHAGVARPIAVLVGAGLVLAAASTVTWIAGIAPRKANRHTNYFASYDHYAVNCREEVGGTIGDKSRPAYLAQSLSYLVAGCRPGLEPGLGDSRGWKGMTIGVLRFNRDALSALRGRVPEGASIPAFCPLVAEKNDPICAAATANGSCHPIGLHTKQCILSAAEARTLAP